MLLHPPPSTYQVNVLFFKPSSNELCDDSVQCLDNLEAGEPADRVSRALQHAGLSITVTSFTDLAAFLIGASTVNA